MMDLSKRLMFFCELAILATILAATTSVYADDCDYSMNVSCPPDLDPQSYVMGLEVQLNGGVGSPICPPVSHIYWDWGDGNLEESFFPAYHEYVSSGEYTILVSATDSNDDVVVDASCTLSVIEMIACSGFYNPMADYPVLARKNRVFPLKLELFDRNGFEMSDTDLAKPPVFDVMFIAAGAGEAVDVSGDAYPTGKGMEGNQFVFTDEGIWQFNLKSKNFSAPGVYMVTAVSGDESEYSIDPACVTSFEIK